MNRVFSMTSVVLIFALVAVAGQFEVAMASPPYMEGPMISIYILSNGEVSGTSNIERNGDAYTFTDNIKGCIIVQKDFAVIDGAGYTLSGEGSRGTGSLYGVEPTNGINLVDAKGVTIKDLNIVNFVNGITPAFEATIIRNYIAYNTVGIAEPIGATITENLIEYNECGISSGSTSNINNKISGNTIANNVNGVQIISLKPANDVISGNNFTGNGYASISLMGCSNVTVMNNSITGTTPGIGSNITAGPMGAGINLMSAHENRIFGNYIAGNSYGLTFSSGANNNIFYSNDFVNREQVAVISKSEDTSKLGGLMETWNNSNVGNYWSNYLTKYPSAAEVEGSGIGDTPYEIDSRNVDYYPLMAPANAPATSEAQITPQLEVQPSFAGSQIRIEGTMSYYGAAVAFADLQISCSTNNGTSWNDIATVKTDTNGNYFVTWLPPDVGSYQIKVLWIGNGTIPKVFNLVYLLVTDRQANNLISMASNSTITLLTLNTTTQEINFKVTGPYNTTGYVKIYISKTLFQNITETSVYMDGAKIDYTASSTDDSWILNFVYPHSTHNVSIKIDKAGQEAPNLPEIWLLTSIVGACIVSAGFLLHLRKRKL